MQAFRTLSIACAGLLTFSATVQAESHGTAYPALELLQICQEADNDSRLLGAAAEVECEQYIVGFVDALTVTGQTGADSGICVPEQNIADEVRWAFMRWVHESYSSRKGIPASDAMLAVLKDKFACS